MPAAKENIVLEEDSNLEMQIEYYDENGAAIDITNYGATMVFAEIGSDDFIKGGFNR